MSDQEAEEEQQQQLQDSQEQQENQEDLNLQDDEEEQNSQQEEQNPRLFQDDFPDYANNEEGQIQNREDQELDVGEFSPEKEGEEQENEENVKRAQNKQGNRGESQNNKNDEENDQLAPINTGWREEQKNDNHDEQHQESKSQEIQKSDETNQKKREPQPKNTEGQSLPAQQQQKKSEDPQDKIKQVSGGKNKGKKSLATPKKNGLEQLEGEQLFSQFLNEVLDLYRSAERAFKSIDKKGKGFLEEEDFFEELERKFGIDNQEKQREIFNILSKGKAQIHLEEFVEIFQDKVEERIQQQQDLLDGMNVIPDSYDPSPSPFKNKSMRDEIIKIFQKESVINLQETNKEEHFEPDSKYASVIRKLRQQPTFDEYVRSYNNLSFPKHPQSSSASNSQHYDPFSQVPQNGHNNNNTNSLFSPFQQPKIAGQSPQRQQLQSSPPRLSMEQNQKEKEAKGKNQTRSNNSHHTHSFLDGLLQKKSPGILQNSQSFKNNYENLNNFSSQQFPSSKISPKGSQSANYGFGFQKLAQSHDFSSNEDSLTPNHRRINNLIKQVNLGMDSLQQVHKKSDSNSSQIQTKNSGAMRDQFKQFMSKVGFETQNRLGQSTFGENIKLDGFLNKISNSSLDKNRKTFSSLEKQNQRGIQGQMKRVKQIQASLRTFPQRQTKPITSKASGLSEKVDVKLNSMLALSSPKDFKPNNDQAKFFSSRQ